MKVPEPPSEPTRIDTASDSFFKSAILPQIPDHEILRCIGRGSYGEVWLARHTHLGTFRAIKVVYRQSLKEDRAFDREFNGLKKFEPVSRSHDGFVDILQVGRNDQDSYFYSVMELADSQEGTEEINPDSYEPKTIASFTSTGQALSYEECLEFGLAASSALAFLHKRGLVHRDIKPSNLILVNGIVKLADVGMVTEAASASIAGGTLGYIAPEGIPSPRADVYALGKVIYELSTGLDRLKHPALPEFWGRAPNLPQLSELNEIVLKACEPDPARRYGSAEELHRELVLLQAGESVKRLRLLERFLALSKRAALALLGVALLVGYEFFRVHQQREREQKRVADVHAASGARLAAAGDFLGALPWYVEALAVDRERPSRATRHRMNIETAIRYSPRIVRMYFEETDVNHLAFSPVGDEIAEALGDGRILVRRLQTGEISSELSSDSTNWISSVSWSSDGRYLLSASSDGAAQVWDPKKRTLIHSFQYPGKLHSAVFNSGNDLVLLAGKAESADHKGGLLQVWRLDPPELISQRVVHSEAVRAAVFSPDDSRILSGGDDAVARLLEAPSLDPLGGTDAFPHPAKAGASSWVYGVAFSPDGRLIATGSFDYWARVWDSVTSQLHGPFEHEGPVRTVEFSPDQRFLLTAGDDYAVRIWDLDRRIEAFPPLRHSSFLLNACFSPDGRLVAAAATGGIVTIWDLAPSDWQSLGQVIYGPDGRYFARIETNVVRVFDAETDTAVGKPIPAAGKVRDLKFTQDGKRLILVSEDANGSTNAPLVAQLFSSDGVSIGPKFSLPDFVPEDPDHWIELSGDGRRMALALHQTVQMWDSMKGRIVGDPILHPEKAARAAWSPDGNRLVTYSSNQVFLVDGSTGQHIKALDHLHEVDYAVFSPNNLLLVTACRDNDEKPRAAYIWEARTGKRLEPRANSDDIPKLRHQDGVAHLAFSSDSQYLLTVGEDRFVKQWRVAPDGSCQLIRFFRYERGFVSAAFNRDSTRIVTVASDDTIRIWDATSEERAGIPLTPPLKHPYNLWDARFAGNGSRVVAKRLIVDRWTRTFEGIISTNWTFHVGPRSPQDWEKTIWSLEAGTEDPDHLRALAELLSAQRIDTDHTVPLSKEEIRSRWLNLTRANSAALDFAPNEIASWHQQQAERCMHNQDAFGALFHLNRLLPLKGSAAGLHDLIARLRAFIESSKTWEDNE